LLLLLLLLQDGKTYPLCPFCYNYPPFEGVVKVIVCDVWSHLEHLQPLVIAACHS
jgi:hypothetical protein